jgi:hypothetical protein
MNTIGRFLLLYILHPVFFVSCAKTESQEIAQPDPGPTDSTVNKPVETGIISRDSFHRSQECHHIPDLFLAQQEMHRRHT